MKKLFTVLSLAVLLGVTVPVSAAKYTIDEYLKIREENFKNNEKVELFTGEWIVGEDINPGRYVVSVESGSGNFFVYDENDSPIVNEILGTNEIGGFDIETVTIDLNEGDKIEISGLNEVMFTPYETKFLEDEITTGMWVVGADIKPGKYIATAPEGESGNLMVFDENGLPVTNEIIGVNDSFNMGVEKVQLKLQENQVIIISGLSKINIK